MRIGIVADIHEAIEPLQRALAEFRSRQVDLVVSLGDACDTFSPVGRAAEVVALLQGAGAVGVWGNHDVGLCGGVTERLRREVAPESSATWPACSRSW
jgi:predicted phosphodiesterase